jgi:NAD(P)-dependent dehydrogenase (short-subunit alcohol dehydrogenase family)
METNFQMNRRILVTGGAGGLGKEITLALLKKGHSVIVLDRTPKHQIPAEWIDRLLDYRQVDLADLSRVQQVLDEYTIHAPSRIDVVIANASPRIFKQFKDFTRRDVVELTHASFTGHVLLINGFLSSMLEKDYGRIIVIGSKSGVCGYSSGSMYCSLKSAWIAFHESLAREFKSYRKNVTITTICPDSFSDTQGMPLRHHRFIVDRIEKEIFKSLDRPHSRLMFIAAFPGKFGIALQYLRKSIRVFP